MRIKVSVTVDIDPAAWTSNYGVEGASEIRADVQAYVRDAVTEQFRSVGVLR